jgi:predicted DNA-binding protein
MKNGVFTGVRVPVELDQRLRVLQERLKKRWSGMNVSKSELIRNLLERGADALEKELGEKGDL